MSEKTDHEVEALRFKLIVSRGESEAELKTRYAPGSFGCHEAMHMASALTSAVSRELLEHGAVLAKPEWFALANRAADALNDLHQAIAAVHMDPVTKGRSA